MKVRIDVSEVINLVEIFNITLHPSPQALRLVFTLLVHRLTCNLGRTLLNGLVAVFGGLLSLILSHRTMCSCAPIPYTLHPEQ